MGNNRINNTSLNLDSALIKVYYDKLAVSYLIINKEKYYLIFSDESIIEIIHNEIKDDDIYKISLLIEEAENIVHQLPAAPENFQDVLGKYLSEE
jgi:hypothetical protein